MKDVLCVILGGGRGSRLFPLTKERCKPACPLFGKYRLIDIPVSNCINSGFRSIYVLTQFLSESLNKHVSRTYKMESFSKGFIEIMAAEQSMDDIHWFQGTADAVRRCLKHFNNPTIKYIFVLAGDQLYKMNLYDMYRQHIDRKNEISVACNYVREEEVSQLGVMGIGRKNRIESFVEKTQDPAAISDMAVELDGQKRFLGSMGIYLFNKDTLVNLLEENGKVDFGHEIIPDAISDGSHRAGAYLFDGYWRDVGTISTFYQENLSLTDPVPPLDLFDESWQIFTHTRYLPPAKFENSRLESSIVAEGSVVLSSEITHSVIGLRFKVDEGSLMEDVVAMGCDYYDKASHSGFQNMPALGVGKGCVIKKAILDKDVRIGDNVRIVNERGLIDHDGDNYYIRDGIVIIPKKAVISPGTVI